MENILRIALISPKGPLYRHRGGIFGRGLRYMPLTFPTLAALIPADIPHHLQCYDEGIEEIPAHIDADIIGMTVITGTASRAYELAQHFRSEGKTVILGGPHVTLMPDEATRYADAIVCGYAEDTWPQLLHDYRNHTLHPRYDQEHQFSLHNRPQPDRSVLPRRKYLTDAVFEATRSCNHSCKFCVAPTAWGSALQRPVADVVADIQSSGRRRAIFVDLNMIADKAYARSLFEALIPLRIHWYGLSTTLLTHDAELLDLCAASGCRGLLMGLESISSNSLDGMQKAFNNPDAYRTVVHELHKRKIALQACFVFGHDGDEPDIFEKTAHFAIDAGIDLPRFAIITPFPGTPLYTDLHKQGRILHNDWQWYDGQHVVFQPAQMDAQTLLDGTRRAWQLAYSWSGMWKRLRQGVAPLPVRLASNFTYRRYAHGLEKYYTCDCMSWDAPRGVVTP